MNTAVNICPTILGGNTALCSAPLGLAGIISSALNVLLFVAFIAALIFLVIGGIKWILSGGDKEATGKAKESITAALIGLAIVIGSWILINIILGFFGLTFGSFTSTTPKLGT